MQALGLNPLQIIIPGSYYDSQIYDSKLYLWGRDSSIITLNWNKLIDNINISNELKYVLQLSMQYGDDLYTNFLFRDPDIRKIILGKFRELEKISVEISKADLESCIVNKQDNPLPFPHADSTIHYKTVYVGGQSGVSASKCGYSQYDSLNSQTNKLCDVPVLSLSASNLTLAIAAGSEGLFEFSLEEKTSLKSNDLKHISPHHSNLVRWLYPSVFSSSYFNEGYFADFKISRKRKTRVQNNGEQKISNLLIETQIDNNGFKVPVEIDKKSKVNRKLEKLLSANSIFSSNQDNDQLPIFTWGIKDKICLITDNSINLVKCFPTEKNEHKKFINIGSIKSEEFTEDIVSADSSFFGIVLEKEDRLVVITSLIEYINFMGEPVNWRVFPKSRNYTNQLHIIYEDCIRIYSFNHDFFVDQGAKKIGISF